jgi:type IV secretory pathway TrbD component
LSSSGDEVFASSAPVHVSAGRAPRSAVPVSAEESRRRMLAARRRLMVMLIGLEIAAISLALLNLAAIWVVVPPTIMLVGYLLLLREAGRADAEFAQHEAEARAAAHARKRAQERARTAARRATPAEGTSTQGIGETAAALAAKFAAAPVPEDYEDAGRDFAPGLAGKYTTSNAHAALSARAGEDEEVDAYEEDEPPRLRAVGD